MPITRTLPEIPMISHHPYFYQEPNSQLEKDGSQLLQSESIHVLVKSCPNLNKELRQLPYKKSQRLSVLILVKLVCIAHFLLFTYSSLDSSLRSLPLDLLISLEVKMRTFLKDRSWRIAKNGSLTSLSVLLLSSSPYQKDYLLQL